MHNLPEAFHTCEDSKSQPADTLGILGFLEIGGNPVQVDGGNENQRASQSLSLSFVKRFYTSNDIPLNSTRVEGVNPKIELTLNSF